MKKWLGEDINPYFPNVPEMGNLRIEYVIFQYDYNILFICKNEHDNLYIVYCCDTYHEQRWIIAPITIQSLIDFLKNKLSSDEVFKTAEGKCCVAWWTNNRDVGDVSYCLLESASEFDYGDLPPENMYMNEDGEHNEYLQEILSIHTVKHD